MINCYSLSIEARFRPEVVERILRVVRHRGFKLYALSVIPNDETTNININLTVISQRSIELLSAQLSKLIDVSCIEIQRLTLKKIRA